jgi:transposase
MLLNRLDPYLKNSYKKKDKGVRYMTKAAIESTGNLWINMYEALEHYGINISLANPLKIRAIAEARIKYDKGASILADLAGADLISKCYVPDKNIREIRTLIRHRIDLAHRRTKLKNKVHTTLDKYMLKYDGDLFTHKGFEWLDSQNLSMIDRQVIINSYLKEISTINELMTNVERQMASLAMSDKRVDLLLGFTGIDYYGALLLLYEII